MCAADAEAVESEYVSEVATGGCRHGFEYSYRGIPKKSVTLPVATKPFF